MKISELNILEFGCLKNQKILLEDGLNVFEGDNESGKSTVWLFIKFMLYGFPKRRQEERIRAVSRDGHCAKGSMTVVCDGEEYRIERSFTLGTRSGTERVHCYRLRDGAEVFVGEEPGEALLHVPREILESTCCIGQMQCRNMGEKKGMEAIRNLLSSADETIDITKIEAKLDEIRKSYRLKKGEGGRLYELQRQLHDLQQRYEDALNIQQRMAELTDGLEKGNEQANKQQQDLELLDALFVQLGKCSLLRRLEALKSKKLERKNLENERQTQAEQSFCGACPPTEADIAQLRRLTETWEEVGQKIRTERLAMDALEQQKNRDSDLAEHIRRMAEAGGKTVLLQQSDAWNRRRRNGTVLLGFGFGLAVALAIAASLTAPLAVLTELLPLGLMGYGWYLRHTARNRFRTLAERYGQTVATVAEYWEFCDSVSAQNDKIDEQLQRYRMELELDRTSESELQKRLEVLLQSFSCRSAVTSESLRSEAERWQGYLDADRSLELRIGVLTRTVAEEEQMLADYREEELRSEISEEIFALSEQDIREAERKKNFLTASQRALNDTLSQKKVELISLQARSLSPMALADELSTVREKLSRSEEYYSALEWAIDGLHEAAQTMSGSITPALNRTAGEIMAEISGGAYAELRSGNSLSPSVSGRDGLTVPLEMMSGGTADTAYLALRIALMKQVFSDGLPPLMLDDALCQLDDGRVEYVLRFLAKQGKSELLQSLLFTCHKREAELCTQENLAHCKIVMASKYMP